MSSTSAKASSSSSSSSWAGAAPVSEGQFAFSNGDFYSLASGQNRHRRATREELSSHFHSGSSEKDHPAHWFEAQLIHYGLKPSKTKSVARMRLFDAVQGSGISVPAHITAIEEKLKKEWTRQDRLAKKGKNNDNTTSTGKAATTTTTTTTAKAKTSNSASSTKAAGANKRKANVIVNVTVNAAAAPAAKKVKTEDETPTKKPRVKQTARRGTSSSSSSRGGGQLGRSESTRTSTDTSRAHSSSAPAASPSTGSTGRRCYARGGGAVAARGRVPALPDWDDSPPPPYSDEARGSDDYGDNGGDDDDDDDDDDDRKLAPLGLLNGQYDVECPYVDSQWSHYNSEFDLVLTLSGTSLWGRFNLGVLEGVIFFETRPYSSSHDAIPFRWRGREDEGPILYNDSSNRGWIKFLGGGRIHGWFDYQGISFRGRRFPGQGTRSEVSARMLQDEWDGYSEREYERERINRW